MPADTVQEPSLTTYFVYSVPHFVAGKLYVLPLEAEDRAQTVYVASFRFPKNESGLGLTSESEL